MTVKVGEVIAEPAVLSCRLQHQLDGFLLDVDFELPGPDVYAIWGHSGAGKTSLLRTIAGLQAGDKADIVSRQITWQSRSVLLPAYKRRVGYVFQEASLLQHLSVEGNLQYARQRAVKQDNGLELESLISLLELQPLLDKSSQQLSGGERQRVAIARSLLSQPQLLLMDEPLASLDPRRKSQMVNRLQSLFKQLNIPVLYVSHHLEEVAMLASHLFVMESGRIVNSGPVEALIPQLQEAGGGIDEPFAVLAGKVTATDETAHLSAVDVSGFRLRIQKLMKEPKQAVRLQIHARDVSLTLSAADDTSILNIIPCRVLSLESNEDKSSCLVKLQFSDQVLFSLVSEFSRQQLSLQAGKNVFAQVKALSVIK